MFSFLDAQTLKVVWEAQELFEPLGMRIWGCIFAPTTREERRNLRSLRRLCSGLSNSRTTMRSPFLDWQNLASDLILATWVFWYKGLRKLRRGRGEFEDLCLMILSALVPLSFCCHSCLPRWYSSWPEARLQGYCLGKKEVPGDMGYCHDIPAHQLCFLSFPGTRKSSICWYSWVGDTMTSLCCLWPGWIYMLRCIGPSFQNAEFLS